MAAPDCQAGFALHLPEGAARPAGAMAPPPGPRHRATRDAWSPRPACCTRRRRATRSSAPSPRRMRRPELMARAHRPAGRTAACPGHGRPRRAGGHPHGQAGRLPVVSLIVPLYRNLRFLRHQLGAFARDPSAAGCRADLRAGQPGAARRGRAPAARHAPAVSPAADHSVVQPRNHGYGAACHAGAAEARAPVLLLLNSDVVPTGARLAGADAEGAGAAAEAGRGRAEAAVRGWLAAACRAVLPADAGRGRMVQRPLLQGFAPALPGGAGAAGCRASPGRPSASRRAAFRAVGGISAPIMSSATTRIPSLPAAAGRWWRDRLCRRHPSCTISNASRSACHAGYTEDPRRRPITAACTIGAGRPHIEALMARPWHQGDAGGERRLTPGVPSFSVTTTPTCRPAGPRCSRRNLFRQLRDHHGVEGLFLAAVTSAHRRSDGRARCCRPSATRRTRLLLWLDHFDRFGLAQPDTYGLATARPADRGTGAGRGACPPPAADSGSRPST